MVIDTQPVLDVADHMLSLLCLCEERDATIDSIELSKLDGVMPYLHPDSSMYHPHSNLDDVVYFDGDDVVAPPIWPINIATATPSHKDPNTVSVYSLKTISTKEARKQGATRFSPMMAHTSKSDLMLSGELSSIKIPISFIGGRWQSSIVLTQDGNKWFNSTIGMTNTLCSLALTMRYEWSVWIGHEVGPRVRFVSDPSGAREVFRLRDIPPGRERRAALRNWVEGHWRAHRNNEEDAIWVRKHLRGATNFNWNGLRCRIQPPDFVEIDA